MNLDEKDFEKLIKGKSEEITAYLKQVVCSAPVPATKSEIHSYILRLDGNGRARTNDFASFLSNKVIDYCIPLSQIKEAKDKDLEYNTTAYTVTLARKARELFTGLPTTGEGGELLLYLLTQSILGIPQLLCKMSLKTNSEVHYHGADGVFGKYDDSCKKFTLYWGESKLYSDITQAMSDCLDSLSPFLTEEGVSGRRKDRDLMLFRDGIDLNDQKMQAAILEYLNPDSEDYLHLQYRGVCLVGYDEPAYPDTPNSKNEEELLSEITEQVEQWKKQLKSRLAYRKLDSFVLKIFIIPLQSVDAFRKEFLRLVG